ncbi:MAG: nucleoside/nucleotide kinase family protein [Ilumatobacter sp.]|uniref:nucleoside/nucleotide kinase family protein n=1 Tax=Ilumatobacter sp. TaxID=1967498 RepID=UPI003299E898
MTPPPDISALIHRLTRLEPHERHLIGLTGAPGVGKSTVSARLVDQLGSKLVVVPMDGFHLASSVIAGTPRDRRRGAPDTFDADGFVALLRRLRDQFEPVVYAPRFDRGIDDPIAGSIAVRKEVPIVLVEGNYLLHTAPPWSDLSEILDETWYLELNDDSNRVDRLIARHVEFGKTVEESEHFVRGSDQSNADLVAATRSRADLVIIEHGDGTLTTARPTSPSDERQG